MIEKQSTIPLFTLQNGTWYALELLAGDENPPIRHFSPIYVFSVTPMSTGKGLLDLDFFHANYPEGFQYKRYLLRVLKRQAALLVAERFEGGVSAAEVFILLPLTIGWLRENLPDFEIGSTTGDDLQNVLSEHFAIVPG